MWYQTKKWSENTRYCSCHATETVRLKKKVDVCGAVEELEMVFNNVPTGSGIQTAKNNNLNVFEHQTVRDLKKR